MSGNNPDAFEEERYLTLLRDEGLRLLSAFKRIEDARNRLLVIELVEALARNNPED